MRKALRAFTLLEILLVLALMSMVASILGWQITTYIKTYGFQNEVEEFYNALKQSQVLALTYRTDIAVHILCEKGVFYYRFTTDEPFSEVLLSRKEVKCKKIKKIIFNDRPVNHLDLFLHSSGTLNPRGLLGFFPDKEHEETSLWVDFQGAFLLKLLSHKPAFLKEEAPAFPKAAAKKIDAKKGESP